MTDVPSTSNCAAQPPAPALLAAGTADVHYNFFDAGCAAACGDKADCATRCGEFNVYQNNGCPVDTAQDTVPKTPVIAPSLCGAALDQTCLTSTGCFRAVLNPSHSGGYYGGPNCFVADASLTVKQIVDARVAGGAACATAVPTQVCRAYPVGWRGVKEEGAGVLPLTDPSLAPLNEELRKALAVHPAEWTRVWANYRLVGVQWGAPRPGASYDGFDPIGSDEIVIQGDPTLANVTMEAYIQGHDTQKSVKVPQDMAKALQAGTFRSGCLGCHGTVYAQFAERSFTGANFTPWRQAHFSHVLDYLTLESGGGDAGVCLTAQAEARASLEQMPASEAAWKGRVLDGCPVAAAR